MARVRSSSGQTTAFDPDNLRPQHTVNTRAHEVTGLRSQKLEMEDDGAVYLAARGRVSWRGVALRVDYAISDDMNFGGEFEGTQQDLEITLGYTLDTQGSR